MSASPGGSDLSWVWGLGPEVRKLWGLLSIGMDKVLLPSPSHHLYLFIPLWSVSLGAGLRCLFVL